jgi:ubiquinone/menaquinone biosynthesis C-methylase UbiE
MIGMATFAEAHYRDKLFALVSGQTEWLDLGCGHQLLPGWLRSAESDQRELSARCRRLVGIDASSADLERHSYLHERVVGDIHHLPFPDNSFTLLTARSVVEHIEQPVPFLREAGRVLRPGGQLLFATPNFLYYQFLVASVMPEAVKLRLIKFFENRQEEDVFKTYYRLNTCRRVEKLARESGFDVESLDTIECLPEFGRLGRPIEGIEKAVISLLRHRWLRSFRAVIVAVLRKPLAAGGFPVHITSVADALADVKSTQEKV